MNHRRVCRLRGWLLRWQEVWRSACAPDHARPSSRLHPAARHATRSHIHRRCRTRRHSLTQGSNNKPKRTECEDEVSGPLNLRWRSCIIASQRSSSLSFLSLLPPTPSAQPPLTSISPVLVRTTTPTFYTSRSFHSIYCFVSFSPSPILEDSSRCHDADRCSFIARFSLWPSLWRSPSPSSLLPMSSGIASDSIP